MCSIKKIRLYAAPEKVNKQRQKNFVVKKKVLLSIKKNTLNTEIKNNLLPWYTVKQTHFFIQGITWYLHSKQVTNLTNKS